VSNFGQENIFIENANAAISNFLHPGFLIFSLNIELSSAWSSTPTMNALDLRKSIKNMLRAEISENPVCG